MKTERSQYSWIALDDLALSILTKLRDKSGRKALMLMHSPYGEDYISEDLSYEAFNAWFKLQRKSSKR